MPSLRGLDSHSTGTEFAKQFPSGVAEVSNLSKLKAKPKLLGAELIHIQVFLF